MSYPVPAPDDVATGYSVPAPDDDKRSWISATGEYAKKYGWLTGPAGPLVSLGATVLTREVEQPTEIRKAKGLLQAASAGYQNSVHSLVTTGRLPDIELDPHEATMMERLVSQAAQLSGDFPAMVTGGVLAGTAFSETGPGAAVAAGAAAFAVPTVVRTSLMQAYSKGEVRSVWDFLDRAAVVAKATNRDLAVGGLTGGAGALYGRTMTPLAEGLVSKGFTPGMAKTAVVAGKVGVEASTMTYSGALLEGRLPEPTEFLDAAIMIAGMHGVGPIANKTLKAAGGLTEIYRRTGRTPAEVVVDAKTDPTIMRDLTEPLREAPKPLLDGKAEGFVPPSKALSLKDRVYDEAGFVLANRDALVNHYLEKNNIINGDSLAELLPSVEANPTLGHVYAVEHGVANLLAADAYARKLAEPVGESAKPVIVLVGNAAVGKTTFAKKYTDKAHVILDTNGVNAAGLQENVNAALRSGRQVDLVYVHAPIEEAVIRNVDRQMSQGRPVPIIDQADMASNTPAGFAQTFDVFGVDPGVRFVTIESTAKGKLRGALEGRDALAEVGRIREDNARGSILDRAVNAYTEHLRSLREQGTEPTREARSIFESGIEDRLQSSERADGAGARGITEAALPSEPGIPEAYQALAAEQAARDAFPGTKEKAQLVLDHPFADIPEAKLPHQINLRYVEGPADLKALQTRMAEVYRNEIDVSRGGTQGWVATAAKKARQVADLTGLDLKKVMEGRKPGDTANAVELSIMGDLLMQSTVDVAAKVEAVRKAGLEATDAMRLDALEAIHKCHMIQADITGAATENARANQYMQRIKELREQGKGISDLVDLYGGDPVRLLEEAAKVSTPEGIAKGARLMGKATVYDMIVEGWKAGLVSGPVTHIANLAGNITFAATRPLVDLGAAAFSLRSTDPNRVRMGEAVARAEGNLLGVVDMLKTAAAELKADPKKTLVDALWADPKDSGKTEHKQAIPGMAGRVIRTPFAALSLGDYLFRVMAERGEAYALAYREAAKEGLNPATHEFRTRMAEMAANPTADMATQIEAAGARFTFTAKLGEKGRAVQNLVRKLHLEIAVPFISTPGNVFKEVARMTPAAPLVMEWRADIKAGGPRAAKAAAEMVLGTALAGLAGSLALAGHISGNGNPDPNKRRTDMAAGWQPYSAKIGNTWYSYQRFQPLGTLIGMAADMAEAWEHMTPEESDQVPKILALAFSNGVTQQTFLQGMAALVDAVSQPDKKGARFVQNLAASTVPAAIGQTTQMLDPYQRQVDSIKDAVKNRIPGLRQTLPPQRDLFGEEVPSAERILGVTPVAVKEQSFDKVRTEAARLGIPTRPAPKAIQLPALGQSDIGQVGLTPEQRDIYGEVSGRLAYEHLKGIVNSSLWDQIPDLQKKEVYERVLRVAHKAGKQAAVSEEQMQQEALRIAQELRERAEE